MPSLHAPIQDSDGRHENETLAGARNGARLQLHDHP